VNGATVSANGQSSGQTNGATATAPSSAVIGLAPDKSRASNLVGELQRGGFSNNDISALLPDGKRTQEFAHEENTKAPEGSAAPPHVSEPVGTTKLAPADGTLAVPGLGPLSAAAPIVAALNGVENVVGGLDRALVEMGIPDVERKQYESKIKSGKILLSVRSDDAARRVQAKSILESGGATDTMTIGDKTIAAKSQ
jgi:hypothetical protein